MPPDRGIGPIVLHEATAGDQLTVLEQDLLVDGGGVEREAPALIAVACAQVNVMGGAG